MTDRIQLSVDAERQLEALYASDADLAEAIDQCIDHIEERLAENHHYKAIRSVEDTPFSMETLYFRGEPCVIVWAASNPQRIVYIGTPSGA